MKFTTVLIASLFCVAYAIPVPEESIDLVKIPLSGDKELDILTLAESDGSINERNKRTIGILRELFPQLSKVQAVEEENLLEPSGAGSDAFLETIRVARETNKLNNNQDNNINIDQVPQASDKVQDQQAAENSSVDELTLDSVEDDENRGKRFLNFGFGASNGQASGSGGGSGNFLFDIIRQTADRVARGAGSAFRVVAGTESLDSAIKNINSDIDGQLHDDQLNADSSETRSARSGNLSLLVSGSSGTEQTDESAHSVDDGTDVGKGDGYTEGIPGPVTRLFVLANRGLSNLIQDLILRIAQTSERVVNFKARLITSLI